MPRTRNPPTNLTSKHHLFKTLFRTVRTHPKLILLKLSNVISSSKRTQTNSKLQKYKLTIPYQSHQTLQLLDD